MPRNLMSVLLDSSKRDPGRSKVLYEIHYRMPQKLSGPFSATHFVQLRRTAEDIAFEQEQKKFELLFDIGEKEATKTNVYGSVFPKKTSHLDSRDGLADAYRYIFKQHNDLFIFGAPETVIDLVARHVIDKKGHSTGLDDEIHDFISAFRELFKNKFRDAISSTDDKTIASRLVRISELGGVRNWIETEIQDKQAKSRKTKFDELYDDFRHLHITHPVAAAPAGHQPSLTARKADPLYHVRWARHPAAWTYTFIEEQPANLRSSPVSYHPAIRNLLTRMILCPSVVSAKAFPEVPPKYDFPGMLLAGAHYTLLPIETLLMLSVIEPEYLFSDDPQNPILYKNNDALISASESEIVKQREYRGHIVSILSETRHITADSDAQKGALYDRFGKLFEGLKPATADHRTYAAQVLEASFDVLGKEKVNAIWKNHQVGFEAAQQKKEDTNQNEQVTPNAHKGDETERETIPIFSDGVMDKYFSPTTGPAERFQIALGVARGIANTAQKNLADTAQFVFFGSVVRKAVADPTVLHGQKMRVITHVAELTSRFWEAIFVPTMSRAPTMSRHMDDLQDDFVCSSMLEGRCLYFSNFMPVGQEEFTETLFIEMGLKPYQQARILQRLNDILSYRSIPLRDLGRVHAAISAFNELNIKLNDIQARISPTPNVAETLVPFVETLVRSKARLLSLQKALNETLEVSAAAARMNAFISYGIAGKWTSANAYQEQILERCEDLREERIVGYAILSDFVKRRLAHSIRYVERMNAHHLTVGRRISELLGRIRTQVNELQTGLILLNLEEHGNSLTELKKAAGELTTASGQFLKAVEMVIGLLKGQKTLALRAESLIILAAIYYVFALAEKIAAWGGTFGSNLWLEIPVYIIMMFVFVVSFMTVGQWLVECCEWTARTMRDMWSKIRGGGSSSAAKSTSKATATTDVPQPAAQTAVQSTRPDSPDQD